MGRRQDRRRSSNRSRSRCGGPRQIRWTYQGIWLNNPTTVEVTLENGALFLRRNGGEKNQLVAQSETTFVCPTCQWGQPYVFTREGDGMATEVREVQVSGAWIFKRVQ